MAFITGASMETLRASFEADGPMHEDYFVYFEEADRALQRCGLPLTFCPEDRVYHLADTTICSPTLDGIASQFPPCIAYRASARFVRRFLTWSRAGRRRRRS